WPLDRLVLSQYITDVHVVMLYVHYIGPPGRKHGWLRTIQFLSHCHGRVHTDACQTSPGHRSSTAKAIPCADLNEVKVCPALAAPERVVLDRRRLARQDSNRERPVNALNSKLNLGQQLARAADYEANELG